MTLLHIELGLILFTVDIVLICLIIYIVRETLQIKKEYFSRLTEIQRNALWIENDDQKPIDGLGKNTLDKLAAENKNKDKKLTTFVPVSNIPSLSNNNGNHAGEEENESEALYSEVPIEIYDTPPSVYQEEEYSVPPEIDDLPLPPIPPKPKKKK